jgi:hypothetical protein
MHMAFTFQKSVLAGLTTGASIALLTTFVMTRHTLAQSSDKTSPLVVRVAVFAADQTRPDDYRDFVEGHLFPTVRTVPGYVGTLLGKDTKDGSMISVSFWRSEADAVSGEEAVGRTIRALPPGSTPRPSKVDKYIVFFRDLKDTLSR